MSQIITSSLFHPAHHRYQNQCHTTHLLSVVSKVCFCFLGSRLLPQPLSDLSSHLTPGSRPTPALPDHELSLLLQTWFCSLITRVWTPPCSRISPTPPSPTRAHSIVARMWKFGEPQIEELFQTTLSQSPSFFTQIQQGDICFWTNHQPLIRQELYLTPLYANAVPPYVWKIKQSKPARI